MNDARTVAALQAALAAEHAAVYGYGVLGARSQGDQRRRARALWEAHRAARDRLVALLTERRAAPVAASPAYRLPVQVTSAQAGARLGAALEDAVTTGYLGLAGVDEPGLRGFAAQAMQEAVARSVRWRGRAPGPAFPGLGDAARSPLPGQ
ncbi:ferritin-like domain-containing protein [Actinomadura craniellae]|uniref:ferritin-like domain-containing protein n=1 Tax=Actinomadura craniellae TaxID=2231787 RepID=UPI001F1839AB|nr:ferritin-like domain-containing protein [Actinomadura craniellae]